jgi:hypothetical protein
MSSYYFGDFVHVAVDFTLSLFLACEQLREILPLAEK